MRDFSLGSLVVDAQGLIVAADVAWWAESGAIAGDVVGDRLEHHLSAEAVAPIRAFIAGGEFSYSAVFEVRGGVVGQSAPLVRFTVRCDDDITPSFVVSLENADVAKEHQRRVALTQATIEKVTDMIIWLDEDGRYVFVNDAATTLLGYSADELSHLRVCDVDPNFDEARWREHWQEVVDRQSFTIQTTNLTKAGIEVPIEVTTNLVEYGGAKFNCSIVRDISERIRFQSELLALNEKITQISITDSLTGVANRRHFDDVLSEEITCHSESGEPLSLLMLDVDFFKAFNDFYGHTVGDECLRRIGSLLASVVEATHGLAARYGGEEFACLLPATDRTGAAAIAASVCEGVASLAIPHAASPIAPIVTVSVGVLTAMDQHRLHDVVSAADACLYQAKRQGRNRIVVDSVTV